MNVYHDRAVKWTFIIIVLWNEHFSSSCCGMNIYHYCAVEWTFIIIMLWNGHLSSSCCGMNIRQHRAVEWTFFIMVLWNGYHNGNPRARAHLRWNSSLFYLYFFQNNVLTADQFPSWPTGIAQSKVSMLNRFLGQQFSRISVKACKCCSFSDSSISFLIELLISL